jgi:hypothetical protein
MRVVPEGGIGAVFLQGRDLFFFGIQVKDAP